MPLLQDVLCFQVSEPKLDYPTPSIIIRAAWELFWCFTRISLHILPEGILVVAILNTMTVHFGNVLIPPTHTQRIHFDVIFENTATVLSIIIETRLECDIQCAKYYPPC